MVDEDGERAVPDVVAQTAGRHEHGMKAREMLLSNQRKERPLAECRGEEPECYRSVSTRR